MNILKDPPKSLMTRRRNKVGQTASITEDIDAAGDRAAEAIPVFARGTNPSVSVMNLGPGFRTAIPRTLPIVVERPARVDNKSANPMVPMAPPSNPFVLFSSQPSLVDE